MALGEGDRVAVMVFDRETRVRLPFRSDRGQVEAALNAVLSQEGFNGGTDITRALYDAASFVARDARREARRAIVILTDDQTERGRDEAGVTRALTQGDVVLSALLTPDAVGMSSPAPWPGTLGDILLGRGPMGRRGPVRIGGRTQSAGTAEIAQRSGGDSMRVNEASAFETTLARIRQRYALHFYLPDGAQPGEERSVEVELAGAARRRYPDAQVRYRRVYLTPGSLGEPTVASAAPPQESAPVVNAEQPRAEPPDNDQPRVEQPRRRRPAVNEPGSSGGWRRVDEPERAPAPEAKAEEKPAQSGGWRRLKPGEQP
jgi:hypothetical protein